MRIGRRVIQAGVLVAALGAGGCAEIDLSSFNDDEFGYGGGHYGNGGYYDAGGHYRRPAADAGSATATDPRHNP